MQGHIGKSIVQLSVALQTGAIDAVELTKDVLAGIKAHSDNAIFLSLLEERALREATASARRLKEGRPIGLLDGIPIAWKDLFDIEGMATTAGSKILNTAAPATGDADVVSQLAAAGMISIGRVNMSEFAFSGLGINPHYGTPHNPASRDVPRVTGGSSSGSAAAVAAGLVPVSIGTDTGGSVRIPAAYCGIVGYKATRGRYGMGGVFPLAQSLDSLGPLCRSVTDAIWVDAAMRGFSAPDVRMGLPEGLTLVVPETIFFDGAETGVVTAFEAALNRLEKAGVRIRRQAFPIFEELFRLMSTRGALVNAEAYVLHRERLSGPEMTGIDGRVVKRIVLGEKVTLADYLFLTAERKRMIADFAAELAPGELLASPTLPQVAPAIAPLEDSEDAFFAANAKTLRNTLIGNFFDWCGVSIPCGTGDAGLPVGFALSGLAGSDSQLLSAALAVERIVRDA